jgi:ribose-phosphate pyrophosphokinase
MMYKERDYSRVTRDASDTNITTSKLIGEIDHGDILLVDDMIDSGGSWLTAARELKSLGARDVYGVVSLPFFNDPAIESFQRAYDEGVFKLIVGTNAVYNPRLWKQRWFLRADVTDLFAEIIFRINADVSVSDFLDGGEAINELLRGSDEE